MAYLVARECETWSEFVRAQKNRGSPEDKPRINVI